MKIFMPLATYVLVGIIGVWLDLREPLINRPLYLRDATLGRILGTVLLWPLRVLMHDNVLLWIASAFFIVWVSFFPRQSPFLIVVVATMLGSLIYALWGQNTKQMVRLYPEEKDKPLLNKIFLRAYRVFMLIIMPGLPIYFITLKLIGVISWSWWWVLAPSLLIYAPFLLFCIFGGVWDTYRQARASEKVSGNEQDCAVPKIPGACNPNKGKCGQD